MKIQLTHQAKNYFIIGVPIASLSLLVYVINTTSPLTIGPAGILLVFALIYIAIVSTFYIVLELVLKIASSLISIKRPTRQMLYYMTSIIGFGPVFLLALHSIGQLEVKDFLLVALLIAVSCFYVSRRLKR